MAYPSRALTWRRTFKHINCPSRHCFKFQGGRWIELAKRPQCIMNYHYSAQPKPISVLLAAYSGRTGHLKECFEDQELFERLTDADYPIDSKMNAYSQLVWDHHYDRAVQFGGSSQMVSKEDQAALKACQAEAALLYATCWAEESWPLLVKRIVEVCTKLCFPSKGFDRLEEYKELLSMKCQNCGETFKEGGGLAHAVFYCETVKYCLPKAFNKFGPRSKVNIDAGDFKAWQMFLERFKANPIHRRAAGTTAMQVRLAYMAMVIEIYEPKNFTHNSPKERIHDNSVDSFDATEWIKDYWQSARTWRRRTAKNRMWGTR